MGKHRPRGQFCHLTVGQTEARREGDFPGDKKPSSLAPGRALSSVAEPPLRRGAPFFFFFFLEELYFRIVSDLRISGEDSTLSPILLGSGVTVGLLSSKRRQY